MSTKFEQLLDYLVNEDHEKANELFHEIVVEKSREIYENLIAEEEADEDMDESMDDDMEESMDDDMEESMDLEDSYNMEAGDETGDETDDFGGEISADGNNFDAPEDDGMDGEEDQEDQEDSAIMDIKNAIAELEAAFAELEQAQGNEMGGDDMGGDDMDMDMDADMGAGDEEGGDDMMGKPAFESRRITREYREKVGNDWEKNSMKTQGQYVGSGSGEKDGAPVEGRSPISSGKGKPTTGATAGNILGDQKTASGTNIGTSPTKHMKGINPESGEKFASGLNNVDGKKSGVKTLTGVKGGHGAEKKGSGPGPVGAGSGDKAGQTSIDPATKRQFLPQHTK
jgi:hypothetical protein